MKTEVLDASAITSLSLDREVVRDLTPEEMNGANGGAAPNPDTGTVVITIASEASPVSIVLTIASLVYSVFHSRPAPQ